MKKNITLLAIAALGMTAFFSCKKSSSTSYNMTATVNGKSFSTSNCYAISSGGFGTIIGTNATSATAITYPEMQILIPSTLAVGTYSVDGTSASLNIDSSMSSAVAASSGTITITSVSPNVAGTFSGTCSNGTTITNGKFTGKTN